MTAFATDVASATFPAETSATFATPVMQRVTLARARRKQPQFTVPSPCVGVCKMDAAKGWCAGCYRTIEELTAWSRATDATKLAVWALVEQRQA